MKSSLSHRVLSLVLVPLVLSLSILIVLAVLVKQAETAAARELHASQVKAETNLVYCYADNAKRALINYMVLKTPLYLLAAADAVSGLQRELPKLKQLISSNPSQVAAVRTIEDACGKLTVALSTAERGSAGLDALLPDMWQSVALIPAEVAKVSIYESRMTSGVLAQEEETRHLFKNVLVAGAFLNIVAAIFLGLFAVHPLTRRIKVLIENNARLGRRTALLPPVQGDDEIARLDKSFHAMASALTEHIRKEEATLLYVNDIICSLDRNLKFIRVNRACNRILGYEQSEMTSRDLPAFLLPETKEKTLSTVQAVISNRSSDRFDSVMVRKDGKHAALQWTVHWSDVDEALFCVGHDITEVKRLERVKQDFVAMVSHDLRSPLTSLQSAFELVEDGIYGLLNPNGRKAVLSSQRNISCLIGLINEILDIEKLEAGMLALLQRETPLERIFDRAHELVCDLAEMRQVKIVIDPTDVSAYVDAERMQQVVMNLLSNAIKYSPAGATVVLITETLVGEAVAKVSVIDRGEGIPDSMKEAVFDRFQQVSNADWKKKGGTGLGLAICKSLVEAHGGTIGLESELGKGSVFWFKVPLTEPPAESVQAKVDEFN